MLIHEWFGVSIILCWGGRHIKPLSHLFAFKLMSCQTSTKKLCKISEHKKDEKQEWVKLENIAELIIPFMCSKAEHMKPYFLQYQ